MRWIWLLIGLFGGGAIVLGAIGAHGLNAASEIERAAFETAVRYHLLHTVTAALTLTLAGRAGRLAGIAAVLFLAAIVLFSGSIYLGALTTMQLPLAPVGGIGFMLGWLLLGICGWRATRARQENGASEGS